jgi:sarcosine oxidase
VPILERAHEAWKELEAESGESLFVQTGGLYMGAPDGRAIPGIQKSATERSLPVERLTPSDVRSQYPAFRIPDAWSAMFEQRSGALFPEKVVAANLKLAKENGAELRFNEPVLGWGANDGRVEVETPNGRYTADRLVIAAGARAPALLADLHLPLVVERMTMFLMEPAANHDLFKPGNCPNASWEYDGRFPIYLQADFGTGVKIAIDHNGRETDPDRDEMLVTSEDEARIRELIRQFVPDLDGRILHSAVCFYTNTPDLNFIIDRHPKHREVVIASACSGHGFKFTSVMGEILADLVADKDPQFDLQTFSISRF